MMTTFSNEATRDILEDRLRRATPGETQRVLCLWLCLVPGFSNEEVSRLVGVPELYVQRLRARAAKVGPKILTKIHGGNRKTLPREQELSLLLGYLASWKQEKTPLSSLKQSYETNLSKKISEAAFLRFLARYNIQSAVFELY